MVVEEYGYDWRGNRIRKSREGVTVRYLVDANHWISHVVAETDGTGVPLAYYTRGGDDLISMERGGAKRWYLVDGHGSVRMLANESGQVTDRWTYDAWGETTSRTGVTENDYQYAGERFDRTMELYQLRARYMDPKTGTFLSLDPHQGNRQDPLSLHKYLYANANPVNNTDPTGLFSLGEMLGGLAGHGILSTAGGLNFYAALGVLVPRAGAIVILSVINYITLETILNGHILMSDLLREIDLTLVKAFLDKTVREVLKERLGRIRHAFRPPGGPSWDDPVLLDMTIREVLKKAQSGARAWRNIWKLLIDGRFKK